MKILMIAPEPFFQPRGTPFSEYYRIKCLIELGHTVDLVTYPIGSDVNMDGLRIIRAPKVPGVSAIKIGPSFAKIPLDISLFFKSWQVLESGKYDAIHSHEEAGIMAVFFSRMYGIPHVYDMHSSLPDQLSNFKFTESKIIHAAFNWMENTVLGSSDAVIAICPALVDKALEVEPETRVTLIENVAESHQVDDVPAEEIRKLREELKIEDKKVILYIGTFETYQGLGMLIDATSEIFHNRHDAVLLMVGGRSEQVEDIKKRAKELNILDGCRFTGMVPHDQVPKYLKVADVLASPRRFGTNTPLKIYSYLRSGRPIVATNLYTHTQVLNPQVSELVDPDSTSMAAGIAKILDDPAYGKQLADAAFSLSEDKYSYQGYQERTKKIYDGLETAK